MLDEYCPCDRTAGTSSGLARNYSDLGFCRNEGVTDTEQSCEAFDHRVLSERLNNCGARPIPRLITPHTVGDPKNGSLDQKGILIDLALAPGIGVPSHDKFHAADSEFTHDTPFSKTRRRMTLPRMNCSASGDDPPAGNCTSAPSAETRITPFVELRSVTVHRPSRSSRRA